MKNILVFGPNGTLGSELVDSLLSKGYKVHQLKHSTVDISDFDQLKVKVSEIHESEKIDCIINCAAIIETALIESDIKTRISSYRANVLGPKNIATICNENEIRFVHISSNYVFSQYSLNLNAEIPVNIYGEQKLLSELYVKSIMHDNFSILRVGWVYGAQKRKSFIDKFISNVKNHKRNYDMTVDVVNDQISTPTSVDFIIEKIIDSIQGEINGIASVAPSGTTTKFGFARKILDIIKNNYNINLFDKISLRPSKTPEEHYYYPRFSSLETLDKNKFIKSDITWEQDLINYMTKFKEKYIEEINE